MGVVNRTCRDCKYYDYDLTCGRPSCLLKLIHLDSLDASLCKDFESLIVSYKKSEPKEEKKVATTRKTKDELMTELEVKETEIKELKEDLKKLEKYKQYEDMANEIRALHEAFMNSGFSDEQAFVMVNNILTTTTAGVVKNPLAFLR